MRSQDAIRRPSLTFAIRTLLFTFILFAIVSTSFAQRGLNGGMGGSGLGMTPLEKLKEKLHTAKSKKIQQDTLAKIKKLLSLQYDSFLQENESELQAMENRVKNLRAQLERRKNAKTQLLELELQRISNEATGLVWPAEAEYYGGGPGMGGGRGSIGARVGALGLVAGGLGDAEDFDFSEETEPKEVDPDFDIIQLRQIALAIHNYESANSCFPLNSQNEDGKAMLS